MTQHLRYAAKSDVGMVRKDNEDSGYAGRSLLVVADGMGGHAAGELASSTVVATLAELDAEELPAGDVLTALDDAMLTSAERIAQFITADPARSGMGTTLTAIMWRNGRIALIHVGDSRAYLLRDEELSQITHDHTYVQTLIDAGRITESEARSHPKRNLLLRAIDGSGAPEGETSIREAHVGDRYLLCSDGLSGVLPDQVLARVLIEVSDPTAAVAELVDLALAAGAPDNVTAVVADVVEVASDQHLGSAQGGPVVVGAAMEQRNRAALPGLTFPDDVGPGGGDPAPSHGGPEVAGGLAARNPSRARGEGGDTGEDDSTEAEAPRIDEQAVVPPAEGATGEDDGAPASGLPGDPGSGTDEPSPDVEADSEELPGWAARHWRGLAALGGVLVVGAIGVLGFMWWLSSQWFVGSAFGNVAVYQGIPQQIGGQALNRVTTSTSVPVRRLPYYDQAQLSDTIEAPTEADALRIVTDLEDKALACASPPAPLGCPVLDIPILGLNGGTTGSGPGSPVATPEATP